MVRRRVKLPAIKAPQYLTKDEEGNVSNNKTEFVLPSIYTEKTQILPSTDLDNLLEIFREIHVDPQPGKQHRTILRSKDILTRVLRIMRMAKYSHTVVPSNRDPILVGDFSENTVIVPCSDIEYLVPLIFSASFRKREIVSGYATLALPDKLPGAQDVYSQVRAATKIHLSPTKVYQVFHKMLRQAVRDVNIPHLRVDLNQTQTGSLDLVLTVKDKLRIHLTPTVVITCKKAYLVATPFDYDADVISDISWRYDYFTEEKKLLERVTTADAGRRKLVLKIAKAVARLDSRLSYLSPYHFKTAMFHMIERDIDFCPGWQRKPMKSCVIEFFESVLDAVESRWLPHIHLSGRNLFEHLPRQGQNLAVKALQQLSEEKMLVRFLRRTMATAEIKYME